MKMFCECAKSLTWIALILLGITGGAIGKDSLPAPLKRCRATDDACLLSQAQSSLSAFKNGIPELNVPGFAPLKLGTLKIDSGGHSSSLEFTLIMTDTIMNNFADSAVFKSIKGFSQDLSKKPLKPLFWTIHTPVLDVRAKYDVNGKILILPIISKGDVTITLNNVQAKTRINVEPEQRSDGRGYLKITDYKTIAKVGSGYFNLSNLFDDNVELRESTLKVLNDEWDALSMDIQPIIIEALDRVCRQIVQAFWYSIPYDELFEK